MESSVSRCAEKLKCLSDETRLAVVKLLLKGPKHVWELNEKLNIDKTLLSHHLRILKEAEIVKHTRAGKSVLYSLSSDISLKNKSLNFNCCQLSFR